MELFRKDWEVWSCWEMCAISNLAQGEVVTSLLYSTLVEEGLTHASFKRFIGREESRRVPGSAMVEKGSNKRNRHRAYIGLLRGSFPG